MENKEVNDNDHYIRELEEKIEKLQKDINESYYRIPKSEFESITRQKISMEVSEMMNKKISTLRNWAAIIVALLSFLGITQLTNQNEKNYAMLLSDVTTMIREQIDEEGNQLENRINEKFDEVTENTSNKLENQNERMQFKFDNMDEKFDYYDETLVSELEETMQYSNIRMLKSDIKDIKNEYESSWIDTLATIATVEELLDRAIEETDDQELISDILDQLILMYYNAGYYEEISKVEKEYAANYELSDVSWSNICLTNVALYEESLSPIIKDRAIAAYNNTLEKVPDDYFVNALRLILHMIDYQKGENEQIKENEKTEARKILYRIANSSSIYTAYDFYDYVEKNKNSSMGKYIESLYELFPDLISQIEDKYNQYLQSS